MFLAYVVTIVAIVANAALAIAAFTQAKFLVANSDEVGVPRSWLPMLGGLKAAGAAGLLLGLSGVRFIGIAAAAGLVLFYIGAVIAHLRVRVLHNIAFPAGFLALAIATLVLLPAAIP